MATFYDNFDRANGAPGGNWADETGTATIVGGYLSNTTAGVCHNTSVSGANRNEASASFGNNGSLSLNQAVAVKLGTSSAYGYFAHISYSAPNYSIALYKGAWASRSLIDSTVIGTTISFAYTLSLVYDSGHLTATYNGSTTVEADDLTYSGGTLCGLAFGATTCRCDWFRAVGGAAPALGVAPTTIGNYGGAATTLVFTGTGTDWGVGTAPITCSVGHFTAQTATDATHVTSAYSPDTYLGAVTFTDTTTGATCTVMVTSDPGTVTPPTIDVCPFEEGFITLANASGDLFSPDWLLTDQSPIIESSEEVPGRLDIINAIRQIWAAHFGTWTGTPPAADTSYAYQTLLAITNGLEIIVDPENPIYNEPIACTLRKILDRSDLISVNQTLDLQDVIDAVGAPTVDLQPVLDAIGITELSEYDSLYELLIGLWGEERPTITNLATALDDIATPAGYTLGTLRDLILALPPPIEVDLTPVLDKLDSIQPSSSHNLTTLDGAIDGVGANATTILADILALTSGGDITLQMILDAIALIQPATTPYQGPPVWPGAENVTLGTPVAYSDDLTITTPMHGILLQWTTPPRRTGLYRFGDEPYYYRAGRVSFGTDSGDLEPPQYLGFANAIYCPTSMAQAASVHFQSDSGAEGTVTPWLRSE